MTRRPAYGAVARFYDTLSFEWPIYRPGRLRAIEQMALPRGARVLDIACGTGLNFKPLLQAIGPQGSIVAVDRSGAMLSQARRRAHRHRWDNIELIEADVTQITLSDLAGPPFDAAVAVYALSLIEQWRDVWTLMNDAVRPGGRIGVVELGLPNGKPNPVRHVAQLACHLGGSDPTREPWRAADTDLTDLHSSDLWAGHVIVRVGSTPRR